MFIAYEDSSGSITIWCVGSCVGVCMCVCARVCLCTYPGKIIEINDPKGTYAPERGEEPLPLDKFLAPIARARAGERYIKEKKNKERKKER